MSTAVWGHRSKRPLCRRARRRQRPLPLLPRNAVSNRDSGGGTRTVGIREASISSERPRPSAADANTVACTKTASAGCPAAPVSAPLTAADCSGDPRRRRPETAPPCLSACRRSAAGGERRDASDARLHVLLSRRDEASARHADCGDALPAAPAPVRDRELLERNALDQLLGLLHSEGMRGYGEREAVRDEGDGEVCLGIYY